jgi:hypothetical protein
MGFDINYSKENNSYSEKVKQQIIDELSRNPSELNNKLIADLLAE